MPLPAARAVAILAVLLALAGCGGGGGGTPAAGASVAPAALPFDDPVAYSSAPDASLPRADEKAAVSGHRLRLNGRDLAYTATAGHLTAADPRTGAPEASLFYVAYTLDGQDPATRPVTFFYNGGPGSATVWLHLGSFGPRRLAAGSPSTTVATPFPLVDNAETLLDASDLVFVDAVGTGWSEAIAPNTNRSFFGVDADAAVMRDFVLRYLEANGRQGSPKLLFGESYGTTRSAVLAQLLETAGVDVDGIVLQSSILDYNANCAIVVGTPCTGYLPSYGAVGAWYGLDSPNPTPAGLPDYLVQLRAYASEQYDPAVRSFLAGLALPDGALIAQLVGLTGLPYAAWRSQFNLVPGYAQIALLPGMLLGRYDARVSAPLGSALARDGDPSSTFVTPSFASAITAYLATELGYTSASSYVMLSSVVQLWSFAHDGLALPDTVPDLATALAQNPKLRVLSLAGYHDIATPFFQTDRDLGRLGADAPVELRAYPGGHMTYLDDTARGLERADLAAFYAGIAAR